MACRGYITAEFVSLLLIALVSAAPVITVIKPGNATVSDNTPDLNLTLSEPSNLTYSWDGGGNISGCKNCTSFNTTYGEISNYTNASAVWHFNENFGSKVFDDSPNGNNGTINGTVWTNGRFGSSLAFDGVNDYVEVPVNDSLNIVKKITIVAWIYPKSWGGGSHVILEKDPTDDYFLFLADGKITFLISTTIGTPYVEGTTTLSANKWYCVAGTYDGSITEENLRVYLNGSLDGTAAGLGDIWAASQPVKIGGSSINAFFNGSVDEVAIFNRTLSATEISNLCSRTLAESSHNVTVHARNATDVPGSGTEYFTVDTAPPHRIDLNSPTNGSLAASTVVFNWTSSDATSNMSSNLTINATVRNASIATNNATPTTLTAGGFSDGLHNWSITSYDDAGNSNTSVTRYFTVDATPPKYTTYNITIQSPQDNESVTCYSHWNDSVGVDSTIVEENATGVFRNHTALISATSGWGNYTISSADLEAGSVSCRFYANDTVGNINATAPLIFIVSDTSAPSITNITNLPNNADDLDPNVRINISANVTDFTAVHTVLLQYKPANETNWITTVMNNTVGSRFDGNFTPNATNNWSYRIVANDTNNRVNTSDVTNLSIDYDRTWTRSPTTFGVISGGIATNATLGTLIITNTGDFDLNFSLSSSATHPSLIVSYNASNSSSVNVSNGTATTIQVNASLPVDEGTYTVVVTAQPTNTNATPSSLDTNATAIAFASGPYLYVTIDTYDPSVTQGDTVSLSASVTNKGNASASGVWLAWQLPSGWSNASGVLNTSISGTLTVGAKRSNFITTSISSSAPTGSQILSALSGSAEGKNGNASVSVTVSAAQGATQVSGGGGGGPSAATHRVTPSYSPSQAEKDKVLPTPKTLEVIKGQNLTFMVTVSNPFPNTTLENISLKISGYKPEYIWITPASYSEIEYGSAKEFTVTIYAPPSENTIYPLTFGLDGYILYLNYPTAFYQDTNAVATRENVTASVLETRSLNLIVYGESPPSYRPAPSEKEALLPSIGPIEVVSGSTSTLVIEVKNPFNGSALDDLTLRIEGYPAEYLTIKPPVAHGIGYQGTAVFKVLFEAPSYFKKETKPLKVNLTGVINYPNYPAAVSDVDGRVLLRKEYKLEMTEEKDASIIIHEVSREVALEALEKAGLAIEDMRLAGLGDKRVARALENARGLLERGDYEGTNQLSGQILETKGFAFDAKNQLEKLGESIRTAEEDRWLKVIESKNLYRLARAAHEREDYPTVIERSKEALAALSLETDGKVNMVKVILDNLVGITLGVIILAYSLFRISRWLKIARISSKLRDLLAEEAGIIHLMKGAQAKYYKEKSMGHETYHNTMREYEDRMTEISAERAGLLAKKPLAGWVDDLEGLKGEDESLVTLLKDAQQAYFEGRLMSRREYESIARRLKTERAMVQERIAVLDASMEKGRREK